MKNFITVLTQQETTRFIQMNNMQYNIYISVFLCTLYGVGGNSYSSYNACYEEKNALHIELSKVKEKNRELEKDVNLWKEACRIKENNEKEDIISCNSEIKTLRIKLYENEISYGKNLLEKSDILITINNTVVGLKSSLAECQRVLNETLILSVNKEEVIEDLEEENSALLKTTEEYKIKHHRCRQRNRKTHIQQKKCKENSKNAINKLMVKIKEDFNIFINSTLQHMNAP